MYPRDLNYKMPAEWVEHERTFISWPVQASMCNPGNYDSVCRGYFENIMAIAEFEPVTVVVNSIDSGKISQLFKEQQRIELLSIEHNDAWLRDNGPTFLVDDDGGVAGVNWSFNAWGGKYAPWDQDNRVAQKVLNHLELTHFDAPFVMEGGSFHVDGEGTLLTTEECLLNPNRNPGFTKNDIEDGLKKFLNIQKVIWLKHGLDGDETDGHVDNIACFVAPGKILMQVCDDPEDLNYAITLENMGILQSETDAVGRKIEIIQIQQPPRSFVEGSRLTLSYLNFYFVNGGVILPIFGGQAEKTDQQAIRVLEQLFPDRRVRTVDGLSIIREGGNVHCTTQQMPMRKKGLL